MGDRQVIHLCFEIVDERFLGKGNNGLLGKGMGFLHELLQDPVREGDGFPRAFLRQEKDALKANIKALFNEKMGYAEQQCIAEMFAGEPYGLSPLGDMGDFRGINATNLLKFNRDLQARAPIEVFVNGNLERNQMEEQWENYFDWERHFQPIPDPVPLLGKRGGRPAEAQSVSRGRWVIGFRTGSGYLDWYYQALVLFNLFWGGNANFLLFRSVR